MPTYTIELSCYDAALDESKVMFVDVTADTQEAALRAIERCRHNRVWLRTLLGNDEDDVVDGIPIDDWRVVPMLGV